MCETSPLITCSETIAGADVNVEVDIGGKGDFIKQWAVSLVDVTTDEVEAIAAELDLWRCCGNDRVVEDFDSAHATTELALVPGAFGVASSGLRCL